MALFAARGPTEVATGAAQRVGAALIDLVYPKRCAHCRERGKWVCAACAAELEMFHAPLCAGCGVPLALQACRCSNLAPGLALLRSAGPFDGWLRDAVLSFKYHDEWARAEHLGRELARVVAAMLPVDALTPVPLHTSRLRARGYNQSALLAAVVANTLNLPVVGAVDRTRATAQQARLSAEERAMNVEGAFAIARGYEPTGVNIIVIDDVVTTGSTINACAKVLAGNGAALVRAATVARQL